MPAFHFAFELNLVQLIAPVYVLIFILVVELRLQRHTHRDAVLKHHDQQQFRSILVLVRIGLQGLIIERVPRASVVIILIRIIAYCQTDALHAYAPEKMGKATELELCQK